MDRPRTKVERRELDRLFQKYPSITEKNAKARKDGNDMSEIADTMSDSTGKTVYSYLLLEKTVAAMYELKLSKKGKGLKNGEKISSSNAILRDKDEKELAREFKWTLEKDRVYVLEITGNKTVYKYLMVDKYGNVVKSSKAKAFELLKDEAITKGRY